MTIFNTPIISAVFRAVATFMMHTAGWHVEGQLPDIPKYVLVGAPHTSNWDFVLFLGVIFYLRTNARYMGKSELFNNPFGWFFRYCGGIPVDRKKPNGLVDQMVQACEKAKQFILVIAPEGTRHRVAEWKMGFYHIAKSAGIPVVMAVVDGIRKTVRVGQVFHPTDEMDADIKAIKGYFAGTVGINPKRTYITLEE